MLSSLHPPAAGPPFQRHVIPKFSTWCVLRVCTVMAKQVVERFMGGSGGSGVSTAIKLIGGATLLGIGISQSMYTGERCARDVVVSSILPANSTGWSPGNNI